MKKITTPHSDSAYWLGRWERKETGWHQAEIEPNLINEFSELKPTRILVPLCGKSLDLKWLISNGHDVIGIEMSPLACEQFFSENEIPFKNSTEGKFKVYRGDRITIYNGDIFEITSHELGKIGAVYDRAALIAMPEVMRTKYAAHLIQLLRTCADQMNLKFLQIALERVPSDSSGPPFSVPLAEIKRLYGKDFQITLLTRERLDQDTPENITLESVYNFKLLKFLKIQKN